MVLWDNGKEWDMEVLEVCAHLDEAKATMKFSTSLNGLLIHRNVVGPRGLDRIQKAQEPNEIYDHNSSKQGET